MDLSKPLGRRDIFGILLPGTILIFVSGYVLVGMLSLLALPTGDLFSHEFLLTTSLLITAYFAGSLLRLFVADDVDDRAKVYLLEVWLEKHQGRVAPDYLADFEEKRKKLAEGNNVLEIPAGFDDWLWRADKFPYHAWLSRFWRTHGFSDLFDFYQEKHRSGMWSESIRSTKSFFNYCKLVILGGDGTLADEVNMAEGLTRFFAGTEAAFRLSMRMLVGGLIVQVPLGAALALAPRLGIALTFSVDWKFQGFHFFLTLVLVFIFRRMCRLIVRRFRRIRQKEVETVYHAFYLYSLQHPEATAKAEQVRARHLDVE
jgi:hypothetical protein